MGQQRVAKDGVRMSNDIWMQWLELISDSSCVTVDFVNGDKLVGRIADFTDQDVSMEYTPSDRPWTTTVDKIPRHEVRCVRVTEIPAGRATQPTQSRLW